MRRRKAVELILEDIYDKYHKRDFVEPDPIQYLYNYKDIKDREIVGLIASSLALGRVASILSVIGSVLDELPSPYENLTSWSDRKIEAAFANFKYRFYKGGDITALLLGIKRVIGNYGSLNACFLQGYGEKDGNVLPALSFLIDSLSGEGKIAMLADPGKGSACKRLMLYLRWMIRSDRIDPGGWTGIDRSSLIIPLDTHMLKVGRLLKLTERGDGGLKTALDITATLAKYDRSDPVRFDFSLTRPGIHPELDYGEFGKTTSVRA